MSKHVLDYSGDRINVLGGNRVVIAVFDKDVDGYYYASFPYNTYGVMSASDLRNLAEDLDEVNAEWDAELEAYFKENPA